MRIAFIQKVRVVEKIVMILNYLFKTFDLLLPFSLSLIYGRKGRKMV